jgi:hypothetical protein
MYENLARPVDEIPADQETQLADSRFHSSRRSALLFKEIPEGGTKPRREMKEERKEGTNERSRHSRT